MDFSKAFDSIIESNAFEKSIHIMSILSLLSSASVMSFMTSSTLVIVESFDLKPFCTADIKLFELQCEII